MLLYLQKKEHKLALDFYYIIGYRLVLQLNVHDKILRLCIGSVELGNNGRAVMPS